MIYTVTLNPALDYRMIMNELRIGTVNRSKKEEITIGGKGINVSLILKELDIDSIALGFTAGFVGDVIEEQLKAKGIAADFIRLKDGMSRINVKVSSKSETELNGQGPCIDDLSLKALITKIDGLKDDDYLVLAGSVPYSVPNNIYKLIMENLFERNIHVVVDATGDLLVNTLEYKPFLIKPNVYELEDIFNTQLNDIDKVIVAANKLRQKGARNVLVSMGNKGALLVDEKDMCCFAPTINGEVNGTVGAGDSMVAGFLAGFSKTKDSYRALRLGSAAGNATAFANGLAKGVAIKELEEKIEVKVI